MYKMIKSCYCDDEKRKLLQKPAEDGPDRKQVPRQPYATLKETLDKMW